MTLADLKEWELKVDALDSSTVIESMGVTIGALLGVARETSDVTIKQDIMKAVTLIWLVRTTAKMGKAAIDGKAVQG